MKLTVLEIATRQKEGRKRTRYACQHCDYQRDEEGRIPRRPATQVAGSSGYIDSDHSSSSSSSSDSSSSFGGGSSDGGGASGNW